ncbi:MAG: SPOR domain-containing protein [Bacteroidales bacterium]|nr:SPOR domain-containing protein [Bacteroidales bacterium]MBP5795346.1 SPOR domain-containing protein [Bacteroidales bacterium]
MKKLLYILVLAAAGAMSLRAQNIVVPQGYQLVDSVVVRQSAQMDTTLMGKNIFSLLNSGKGTVTVSQPDKIRNGMTKHIEDNKSEKISGYRVRIYFDNKQNSRGASEEAQRRFQANHPGIMAYRSFTSPFFKVTVGDFRTRSEAIQLMQQIQGEFPTAFIVKETINYPVVDKRDSYIIDTLHLVRPITPELSNL